jgi:hypothetical protein
MQSESAKVEKPVIGVADQAIHDIECRTPSLAEAVPIFDDTTLARSRCTRRRRKPSQALSGERHHYKRPAQLQMITKRAARGHDVTQPQGSEARMWSPTSHRRL